jgi:DNA-binding MarR family transcriptional regulator
LSSADLVFDGESLTLQEWKVLSIVADSGPMTPFEIKRHGTQEKSTISWAIKRLDARGFLERRSDPGDRRTFTVRLSDEGWTCYRALIPKARRRARRLLAVLSPDEAAALQRIVDKLDSSGMP